jgi:hypothetical protein
VIRARTLFGTSWRDAASTALATTLLALFWWLAVSASIEKSQTSDELPHIAGGYIFNLHGDFRTHPENGILPQRLFGLPPLLEGARLTIQEDFWRTSRYWHVAWDFFYAEPNPTDWFVLCARAINALFGVALGLLIFCVTRSLWGAAAALTALGFFALSPNFLAHGALATSDMAATFFLTLAPWLFWHHLERRDLRSGLTAALASGLTLLAKYNGLLLAPIYAALILLDAWLRGPAGVTGRLRRAAGSLGLAALQAGAGALAIWACFNFRFSGRGPAMPTLETYAWAWSEMLPALGLKRHVVELCLRWELMPEAWLYGLCNVLAGASSRLAFFAGEHGETGWWLYFPALFLAKTPLSVLAALGVVVAVVIVTLVRRSLATLRTPLLVLCPLLVSAAVIWMTALRSNLNIGDRHILGIYPLLFVAAGALAARPRVRWLVPLLVLGCAWESFSIRPHYLASFNALVGGPAHAHRLFADSTIDWGQDLPSLRTWLRTHRRPGEKVYLNYFGSAWPPHYEVRPTHFLPAATYIVRPPIVRYELEPGLYCVSATQLAEVYSNFRGPWRSDFEAVFRALRSHYATPGAGPPPPPLPPEYEHYDQLRFARLAKYLQRRAPDGHAGYSILIFRLDAAEIDRALSTPVMHSYRLRPR